MESNSNTIIIHIPGRNTLYKHSNDDKKNT